jgi:hypothetical protein
VAPGKACKIRELLKVVSAIVDLVDLHRLSAALSLRERLDVFLRLCCRQCLGAVKDWGMICYANL